MTDKPSGKKPRVAARARTAKKTKQPVLPIITADLSQEALMTIIAIMKDNDDPKLQMAAAKMLLDKNMHIPRTLSSPDTLQADGCDNADADIARDDIEMAIALAKELLDAMAAGKTQKLDSAGEVAINGAAGTDNAADTTGE